MLNPINFSLEYIVQQDKNNAFKKTEITLSEDEWLTLNKLEGFLEPFYQATLIFSESKLPTANQKDLILAEIKEHLESKANDSILSVAVDAMMEKFESLFNDEKV